MRKKAQCTFDLDDSRIHLLSVVLAGCVWPLGGGKAFLLDEWYTCYSLAGIAFASSEVQRSVSDKAICPCEWGYNWTVVGRVLKTPCVYLNMESRVCKIMSAVWWLLRYGFERCMQLMFVNPFHLHICNRGRHWRCRVAEDKKGVEQSSLLRNIDALLAWICC